MKFQYNGSKKVREIRITKLLTFCTHEKLIPEFSIQEYLQKHLLKGGGGGERKKSRGPGRFP